jgi:hypothetical protein
MAALPVLLLEKYDKNHRCHFHLNPNRDHPPQTFRLRTITNAWPVPDYAVAHLQAYGLLGYAKLTSGTPQFILDPSLLTSLADRWRPETHTFHFRCGELAPTLKDVSMITALPIRGEPMVPPAASPSWRRDVANLLRRQWPATKRTGQCRGIPHGWIHTHFQEIPRGADPETRKIYLFAYLLWLLGTMFPNSHGDVVHPSLIYYAQNIVDESLPLEPKYSFGSAMIAHTYRGLCDATQKSSYTTKHPLLCVPYEFLQLWSLEYLPVGRPTITNPITPYDCGEGNVTMSSRWTHARKKWATDIAQGCYPVYHEQFELLSEFHIRWNPWTEQDIQMVFGCQRLPVECVRDSGFWLTRCNVLCLWFVEAYNPERVMRQFGLYQAIPPPPPTYIDDKTHK